jgi:hypothetical protein
VLVGFPRGAVLLAVLLLFLPPPASAAANFVFACPVADADMWCALG